MKSGFPAAPSDSGTCLQQVVFACGDEVCNVIRHCLEADYVEQPNFPGKQESADALRLQRVTVSDIAKALEQIAGVL
jgi:hypothetical protein